MNNGSRILQHFRTFYKGITNVLPQAKTAILSNYAATLNPETDAFKRLLNGPLMSLESIKTLYQNKAKNLSDKLQKKADHADELEKQFVEQLNQLGKDLNDPLDRLIAKLEKFVKQPDADIPGHEDLKAFTNEIKQMLLPRLKVIHTAEANPIPHPGDEKLSFAEYVKRTKARLDSLINNTSMSEKDMDKLKPIWEQFRNTLPAEGENATAYDKYVLGDILFSLKNANTKLRNNSNCIFPEYTVFVDNQWNYLHSTGHHVTNDVWEDKILSIRQLEPIRDTRNTSPEEKALYNKATWLNNIPYKGGNQTLFALNKEISELLSSDRFHEICIEKKNETSNKQLQNSKKMRNLAICLTLKAIIVNEQLMLKDPGPLNRFMDAKWNVNQLEDIKSMLSKNKTFNTAYKALNNQGMYNFIMKDGYRDWAKNIAPSIYDSMKKYTGKLKHQVPQNQNDVFACKADKLRAQEQGANKQKTNKLP